MHVYKNTHVSIHIVAYYRIYSRLQNGTYVFNVCTNFSNGIVTTDKLVQWSEQVIEVTVHETLHVQNQEKYLLHTYLSGKNRTKGQYLYHVLSL